MSLKDLDLIGWITAIEALLIGIIAISLLVPGEQPEKALQGIVDFLANFSRKPKAPEAKEPEVKK